MDGWKYLNAVLEHGFAVSLYEILHIHVYLLTHRRPSEQKLPFFSRSQHSVFAGHLTFTLGEQETGIAGIEVALSSKMVKRQTGHFVFAQE